MFKGGRWRNEKNKIRVEFKLQFKATQVLQLGLGRETLIVSLIPVEVGKPTAKSEKATINDGTCRWEKPVYEIVKFIQEPRTGRINDKIYHFIVSSGSSKGGIIGEVKINLADYADAIKPYYISLPLASSKSQAVLHVAIERVNEGLDQREEIGDTTPNFQDNSLRSQFRNNSDTDGNDNRSSIEDELIYRTTSDTAVTNGDALACLISDTISATSADSSSERNTPRELGFRGNNTHQNPTNLLSSLSRNPTPQNPIANGFAPNHLEHRRSNTDWSAGSAPDGSLDDSANSSDDNLTSKSVGKLKGDLVVLARQAEVSDLELQTLRKQVVKESRRGQDLLKEVVSLKEERNAFKKECEQLKSSFKQSNEAKFSSKLQFESEDPWVMLHEIRQELNHEKELNNNLRLQLQKTQDSNSELILAVQDLDELLEQKSREVYHLPRSCTTSSEELPNLVSKQEKNNQEDELILEEAAMDNNAAEEAFFKDKVIELSNELDMYKRDRDELEMQMEQLALDYEILKQENHEILSKLEHNHLQDQLTMQYDCTTSIDDQNEYDIQVENLEREIKKGKDDLSASVGIVNELKSQVENLQREFQKREHEYSVSSSIINELRTQIQSLEKEIKKREEDSSSGMATINDLESHIKDLENDLEQQTQLFSASLTSLDELEDQVQTLRREAEEREGDLASSLIISKGRKIQIESLEGEIKKREEDHLIVLATINKLKSEIESLKREIEMRENDFAASSDTVNELTSRVESLEREIKKREEESSAALLTITDLESHTKILEKELEEQAELFEADLEVLTNAKVEQEKKAIQAEEALRKTRWVNANTAERLQKEFKRLSAQMASTFDANERLAMKALTETNELRMEKIRLGEMIEKSNEDFGSVKDQYEEKLKELSCELNEEKRKAENLLLDLEDKSKKIEHQTKLLEDMREVFTNEIQMLKIKVDKVNEEKLILIKQVEEKVDSDELERRYTSVRKQVDEKELNVRLLQSEIDTLEAQNEELKQSFFEDEVEKENFKKQLFNLTMDLEKKEDTIKAHEKKIKDMSKRATSEAIKTTLRINKSALSHGSKEVEALREKIQLLEGQIKVKEATLEKSAYTFLEKEKDLQIRIEELESKIIELDQESTSCFEVYNEKEVKDDHSTSEEKTKTNLFAPKGSQMMPIESNGGTYLEQKPSISHCNTCDQDQHTELLNEMRLMKAKNHLMEAELKDMQRRYSEISLKFAEVEGERQTLVMRVRNLKNAKKT